MVIDTDKILSDVAGHLNTGLSYYEHVHLGHVGLVALTGGCVLGLFALYKDWRKKKGYRMAVRERTTKETELLGQIINDGLFEAECAGKISNQRVRALYADMAKKLNLPDLVPKQHRLPILKEELKRKRIKEGKLDIAQWKRTTFSDTVGKFKFW